MHLISLLRRARRSDHNEEQVAPSSLCPTCALSRATLAAINRDEDQRARINVLVVVPQGSFSGEGSRTDVGSAMRSPPNEKRSFETVDASEPSSVASNSSPCSDIYCNSRSSSSVDEAELNPSTPPSNRVRTGDGDQYSGPYHSPYRPYMEPLEGVAVSTTLVPSAEPPRVNREIDISNHTQSNGTGSALGESFLIQREKPSTQAAGGMELAGLLGMARRADEEESRTPREKGVSRVVAELSPWRHDGTADDDDETLSSQNAPE